MTTDTPLRAETAPSVPAFKLFRAEVVGATRLSPHLARITFGGAELSGMTSGGLDQRIKLLFPLPGQVEPCLPEGEQSYQALRAVPEDVRPRARTYTVRAHRPQHGEFDVDFVLHGDTGPGSIFGGNARPGEKVGVYAPNAEYAHGPRLGGVEYKLDALQDRTLIIGDEASLPAIGSILETLPDGVRAKVYVEISDPADMQGIATLADVEMHWLRRGRHGAEPGAALLEEVRSAHLPGHDWYAWVAGESSMVKAVRRHLVNDRGMDRRAITFMGYWRHGRSEDTPAEPTDD
jgi:NADPH-dependent ferric siderophore reductase